MAAYYNEFDPYAAEWLRNLIVAGLIAPGEVDGRSILDVRPDDLREFTQCHFFAGIGVWSHALRLAGWPDDRPVWTGSCPCQPFSVAGAARGFADERHLWPAFHFLIEERRPPVVFGEQVASKDGLAWLDLVQSDMEGTGYAFAPFDICAAGVGAPHIRQRLWFVADACSQRREQQPNEQPARILGKAVQPSELLDQLGHIRAVSSGMDDDDDAGLEGLRRGHQAEGGRRGAVRSVAETGESGGLADAEQHSDRTQGEAPDYWQQETDRPSDRAGGRGLPPSPRPGPTNGHWRDADWLFCRDGKWRPVEPSTFPLAHGAAARVGRLRAYGNAIVPQVASEVIAAFMEVRP